MTFDSTHRMEWLLQRWHKDVFFCSALRSLLSVTCLLLVLIVSLYPGLWSIGVRLHSVFTGNYLAGHHSVLVINSPTEQTAKDIGRAIMEKRLAASINILTRTSTMYIWKDEIRDASEILMLVKTRTSRIQHVLEYVRSVHPYAAPEVLSILVEDGSLEYLKWMDEVIPEN
ncbi:protein CutA homolog isoform X1 [Periophthalmus magnuspinnatus]|uniref:protein CutA homolog isoform X1 n=1 Tax=Periophthalmus magnuspinnatus TaxID=409849 RepID=UPI00145AC6FB|nr:protein CutA homolog isoform X1 [Periophthalmus magnuspinnatus]